jgi:hypothetical protein
MTTPIPYCESAVYSHGEVRDLMKGGVWRVSERERPEDWRERCEPKDVPAPKPKRDWAAERHAASQKTRAPHKPGAGRPKVKAEPRVEAPKAPRLCADCRQPTGLSGRAERCKSCSAKRTKALHNKARNARYVHHERQRVLGDPAISREKRRKSWREWGRKKRAEKAAQRSDDSRSGAAASQGLSSIS